MHMLLIPIGSSGDVHPFLGIGTVLKKRGHRVTIVTNGYFRSLIEKAGFKFIELGTAEEFHAVADNPDLWHPTRAFPLLAKQIVISLKPLLDIITRAYVLGETMVVAGSLAFGARLAQEKLKIPTAMVHLQPSIFRSVYAPPKFPALSIPEWFPPLMVKGMYRLVDFVIDQKLAGPINTMRKEWGLAPIKEVMGSWWHSPHLTLGLFPDWYYSPQKDWPPYIHLTGFPLFDGEGIEATTPGLKEFLETGAPPVVFTAGSAMKMSREFFRESIDACRIVGCRAALLTRFPDQLPQPLPPNIQHFSYLPFSRIFPHAAVVVHHGGIGTTAQALKGGVPQLIVPFSHDQPDNASRVEKLGVGLSLRPAAFRAKKIATYLNELIKNGSYKKAARQIADRMESENPLEKTCDLIEALSRKRPSV